MLCACVVCNVFILGVWVVFVMFEWCVCGFFLFCVFFIFVSFLCLVYVLFQFLKCFWDVCGVCLCVCDDLLLFFNKFIYLHAPLLMSNTTCIFLSFTY